MKQVLSSAAPQQFAHPNLPMQLLAVREQLMKRFRPILARYNITEQQWRILRALFEDDGLEPRQICQRCVILSPSLVGILQRMEQDEWIRRTPSAKDQRRITIHLTGKARALIKKLNPPINAVYADLETLLGADSLRQLQDRLGQLSHLLGDERPGQP